MRSALIIIVLISVAIGGVMLAVSSRQPPKVEKRAEPVLAVKTLHPQFGEYAPVLFLIGKIEARDYVTLTAPAEADILKINFYEGDFFRANQQLLLFDNRDLILTAKQQQANLTQLQTNLTALTRNRINDKKRLQETERLLQLAEIDHKRNQSLMAQGVISDVQLETTQKALLRQRLEKTAVANAVADYDTQLQSVQAGILAAKAALSQTQLLIDRAEMPAPFTGRVVRVHTAVGARPARGTPLFDIFDPSNLRLRVAMPQRHVAAVKAQENLFAILSDNTTTLTLSAAGLEPHIETGNSGINTFFNLPAGDWIPGALYDVAVQLPKIDAIPIPADALYNDKFIYRINADNRAESLNCEPRGWVQNDGRLDVLTTCPLLQPTDSIIANHLPNLLSGVKVTVVNRQE